MLNYPLVTQIDCWPQARFTATSVEYTVANVTEGREGHPSVLSVTWEKMLAQGHERDVTFNHILIVLYHSLRASFASCKSLRSCGCSLLLCARKKHAQGITPRGFQFNELRSCASIVFVSVRLIRPRICLYAFSILSPKAQCSQSVSEITCCSKGI